LSKTIPTSYTAPTLRQWQAGQPIVRTHWRETLRNHNHLFSRKGFRCPLMVRTSTWQTDSTAYTYTDIGAEGRDLTTYNSPVTFRRPYVNSLGDTKYGVRLVCYGYDCSVRLTLFDIASDATITTLEAENTAEEWAWFEASMELDAADVTSGGEPILVGLAIEGKSTNEGAQLWQVHVHEDILTTDDIDPEELMQGTTQAQRDSLINAWRCGVDTDQLFADAGTPITGDGDTVGFIKDVATIGCHWIDRGAPVYVAAKNAVRFDAANDEVYVSDTTHRDADLGAARLHRELAFALAIHLEFISLPSSGNIMCLVSAGSDTASQGSYLFIRNTGGTYTLEYINRDSSSDVLTLSYTWSTPVVGTEYTIGLTRTSAGVTQLRLDGSDVGTSGTPSAYSSFGASGFLSVGLAAGLTDDLDAYVRGFAFDRDETTIATWETWVAATS